MKKDFQKVSGLLSKIALVLVTFSAAQASFAQEAQGLQAEVPAHGRATLTIEDLQTILGLKTRDPSSQAAMQQQDVAASAPIFDVKMSGEEKAHIAKALSKLRNERSALAQKLEVSKAQQVRELRAQRRNIQISRTRSSEENASLGQNLFVSLLAEANAEAGVESALVNFDQSNVVEVQYSMLGSERKVAAIKVGNKMLWSNAALNTPVVAAR